jgi:hypothetical protein
LKTDTIIDRATELWKQYQECESPNMIVSLQDGFLQPFNRARSQFVLSAMDGDSIGFSPDAAKGMGCLIALLNSVVRTGRTVDVDHFKRYFIPQGTTYTVSSVLPL